MQRGAWAAAACLWLLVAPLALAQTDERKTRDQLQQLKSEIQRINTELGQDRARQGQLQEDLRKSEVALSQLASAMLENQEKRAATGRELSQLEQQRDTLEASRNAQQARVREELVSAYRMGRDSHLKVLLNQAEPGTLARALRYYEYIYEARSETIDQYRQTLAELDALTPKILATNAELEAVRRSLADQQRQLQANRQQRQQTLAALERSMRGKDDALKQLQLDQVELQRVLDMIEEALVNLELPDEYRAFGELRGDMPWPLQGKRRNRFGQSRNSGNLRWQGVTIAAPEGSTVQAIHHGRVVYADWLRGSGLLLILDHGDGYMSLYAHNQTLLREVGEWVSAGSAIATVGDSGGQQSAALYFEIRHNGKPQNPTRWCKG